VTDERLGDRDQPDIPSPSGADDPVAAGSPERHGLPADPAAYDAPRAQLARARGLDAPYIAGGRDPDPDEGIREERLYGRLLLVMVIGIVGISAILTIVAIALGAFGYSGR
jgi:hypothetical protein